jgi:hypothetical protein
MTANRPARQPPQGVPSPPGEPQRPATSGSGTTSARLSSTSVPGLLAVSHRLTDRDLHLARLLAEHRTLTTAQITALLFAHPGTARNRLRQLREIGFLDRFTHRTPTGGRVTCWVPGLLAARYVALADGQPAPTPRAVRQSQDRTLASPQLDHLLGVNQFFTDLLAHTRTHPGTRLARWWSAEHAAAAFAGRIHPDGHGLWQTFRRPTTAQDSDRPDRLGERVVSEVGFWVEHDTGTEPLGRVVAKLGPYHRLQQAGGPSYPILFRLPNRQREDNLHRLLATDPVTSRLVVATSVHTDDDADPAAAVWRLAARASADTEASTPARRLQDLPGRPTTVADPTPLTGPERATPS